tara:strand:+ start:3661 stop:4797 length:1137 start_codon:yes stop_codon:yes gene_type:complete
MNSIEANMEQAIQDAGFEIMDGPPPGMEGSPNVEQPQLSEAPPQEQPAQEAVQQEAAPQEQATENIQENSQPVTTDNVETATEVPQENDSLYTQEDSGGYNSFADEVFGETPAPEAYEEDTEESYYLDPRIQVIADFVEKTGRAPEDWFRYQALDPEQMGDQQAVKLSLSSEYPNLSNEEIDLLVTSKYKVDEDIYTEDEVRLSNLQLKMDADKARGSMSSLREGYMSPEISEQSNEAFENPFDNEWQRDMTQSVTGLSQIDFDLPGGKEFSYGVPETYRSELTNDNTRMTEYFDKYVDTQGEWDHDLWNMHRTVTDNLPSIVKNIYQQGLSDGQRAVVETAANVKSDAPRSSDQPQDNSLAQQVIEALGTRQQIRIK